MELKKVMRVLGPILLAVLIPTASFAQQKTIEAPKELSSEEIKKIRSALPKKQTKGGNFFIASIDEQPNRFSFLLSDANNRTVADSFSLTQMLTFKAVMVEAKKFASTSEAAGTKEVPSITRFVDKKDPSFIVDVEKAGTQSRYYITLDCLTGRITVDAGVIKRGSEEQEILFTRILTGLEALRPTPPKQLQ
jgi:hypothetical protein